MKPDEPLVVRSEDDTPYNYGTDLYCGPFGWFPTWIVARRYYTPVPPPDVALICERQSDNLSDPDAIAVYGPHGGQVGHLPRYDAAYLAPLLDRAAIRLTARLSGDSASTTRCSTHRPKIMHSDCNGKYERHYIRIISLLQ